MQSNEYKKLLNEFVSFKSISTDSNFKTEIQKTVEWLSTLLKNGGFNVTTWNGPKSNPVVVAKYITNSDAQTVMVYGHYDVQPAELEDGWYTDPFTTLEKDGKIYGRGVVDNKGQVLIHIHTVLKLIEQDNLKYNVIFMIEGNEETSNDDLGNLVSANKEMLKVNHILVSDGEIVGNSPVVEYALRGGFNCKIIYKALSNNLHSGLFGGVVPNPAHELTKFVSSLFDEKGKTTIPGFYDEVDEITAIDLENNKKIPYSEEEIFRMTGAKKTTLEDGLDMYSQVGLRPTIQVTGILSGYVGEGFANIVPATAEVRINFRTVKSQNSEKILSDFKKYVMQLTPEYIDLDFSSSNTYEPVKIVISSEMVKTVSKMLTQAYGTEALNKPVGGGIPIVTDFKDHLGIDSLLVSLGNEDCNMHGVNENFTVDLIEKGLKFSEMFFSKS